jgi:hypothetical protein
VERTWQDARNHCTAVTDFDLASVEDAAENNFVNSNIPDNSWLGGTDATLEGSWVWIETGVSFWQGGPACPSDASLGPDGRCWHTSSTLRTRSSARTYCQNRGAGWDLAKITSSAVNSFAHGLFSSSTTSRWIGANDIQTEGTFLWTDGTPLAGNYTNWDTAGGEPNGSGDGVRMYYTDGKWADTNTTLNYGTLCDGPASGAPVGGAYANWKSDQPNNVGGTPGQDCLVIDDGLGAGKWLDDSCGALTEYVCEGLVDQCPDDPNKITPGICGCGVVDDPTDTDGDGTADCIDGCPDDPGKVAPGVCDCGTPDVDSDGDGTLDCQDGCPSDAGKLSPGACGCGSPDVDTDGDGALDCNEECPTDARYTTKGDCGCSDDPAPSGTACDDGLCPANTACDAMGTCGNPQACAPDTNCTLRYFRTVPYWFCGNDINWTAARALCLAKEMDLVHVESAEENAFLEQNIDEASYIGATDAAVAGEWRWVGTQVQFWQGDQNGVPVAGQYNNWESDEPDPDSGEKNCAEINTSGDWNTEDCTSQPEAFICERIDVCESDPAKLAPGACGCGIEDFDSDGDLVADCIDGCPEDDTKTEPGICGCGVPDDDSDGDGIAACKDECPLDNDPTAGGECGCPSSPEPSGTACCDGICGPGACDGAGHCGDAPSTCSPDPSCSCTVVRVDARAYWYCPCSKNRDDAQAACAGNPGRSLVQIGGAGENALVASLLTADAWIAGNDRVTEGEWRWTTRQRGDAGPRFWTGDAAGEPYFGVYTNWQSTEPGGGADSDCMAMTTATGSEGTWYDSSCTSSFHVACEVGVTRPNCAPIDVMETCEILGQRCKPTRDDVNCESMASAFQDPSLGPPPDGMGTGTGHFRACTDCVNDFDEQQQADAEATCTTEPPTPPECSGNAEPPPAGSMCTSLEDELLPEAPAPQEFRCALDPGSWGPSYVECEVNADCSTGACGLVSTCTDCVKNGLICTCRDDSENPSPDGCPDDPTPGAAPNRCVALKVCGVVTEEQLCPSDDPNTESCKEVEICGTLGEEETFPNLNDETQLTDPFTSEEIEADFGSPESPANPTQLPDDPCGPDPENCPTNDTHPWCSYGVADDPSSRAVSQARTGDAGMSTVSFMFTPEMDIDLDVNPGPFGLMKFTLGAIAQLDADVGINLNALSVHDSFHVVDFLAQVDAELSDSTCGIDADFHFEVLDGLDILPTSDPFAFPTDQATRDDCARAVRDFQEATDRAKKAYADARELLRQYYALQAQGKNFGMGGDGLCAQIADEGQRPLGFPLGNCATERPEQTINRFITFYQEEVTRLTGTVADEVSDKITAAFNADAKIALAEENGTEEIIIFTGIFPIGPIPLTMQVLLTMHYKLPLDAVTEFRPGLLLRGIATNAERDGISASSEEGEKFAYLGLVAAPEAGTGVGLFVGVGFDIGIAAAKVGIQGSVNLGSIKLPVEVGAGIAIGTEPDRRAPAAELDPTYVLTGTDTPPLIPLKKYEIRGVYKYGARLELENVLHGSIDVVVKLKFLFFSKKFKAHIVSFTGLCPPEDPPPPGSPPPATSQSWCKTSLFGGYEQGAHLDFEAPPWATVLMSQAFHQLRAFQPADFGTPGSELFETGRIGIGFYDSLCTCIGRFDELSTEDQQTVDQCFRNADCCGFEEGDFCFADPNPDESPMNQSGFRKCTDCRMLGESCNTVDVCCADNAGPVTCRQLIGEPFGTCRIQSNCGEPCGDSEDCNDVTPAGDLECDGGLCKIPGVGPCPPI